jgi:hypothetical protein
MGDATYMLMNVAVRRLPLLLLSVAGLLSAQITHAQSVATNPVGYNMFSLPAGNSIRVNTFVQATAFQGTASAVTSATNSVITLSSSATALTSGSFAEVNGVPAFYVEILDSGSAQGLIADIVSNGTNTITVATNLISFGANTTTSFCVRAHTTLSSLFPVATSGLQAGQDYIELYPSSPNSPPEVFDYTGVGDGWINANNGGSDAGTQVIYPGQGFIIFVKNAKTVPVVGYVKPGQTQVPLYQGAINIVGNLNPVVSGTQTLANFNFPSCLQPGADSVVSYADDGTLQPSGSFITNGTDMYSSSGIADSFQINSPNAVIVQVANQGKTWIMPSFYKSGN